MKINNYSNTNFYFLRVIIILEIIFKNCSKKILKVLKKLAKILHIKMIFENFKNLKIFLYQIFIFIFFTFFIKKICILYF